MRAKKRAVEIDVDHRLPLREGQFVERDRGRAGAGVVEQEIEPAEVALDRGEQSLNGLRIADVARRGDRAPPEAHDLARCLVQLVAPPRHNRHMPPGARERERRRLADPGAAAGDQRKPLAVHGFLPSEHPFASQIRRHPPERRAEHDRAAEDGRCARILAEGKKHPDRPQHNVEQADEARLR